jgi:uncharacterized membrane protein YphA (DoxX/SURF4 family)
MRSRWVSLALPLCRWLAGGVFLYAGAVKAGDVAAFAGEIAHYQLLPNVFNVLLAATLPYIEMLAGTLLVFNRRVRAAALVVGGLNLVFIIALVSALVRGLDIDCGCFGVVAQGASTVVPALLRDVLLMVPVVFIFLLQKVDFKEG